MHIRPARRARPSRLATLALASVFVILVSPSCRQGTEPLTDQPPLESMFRGRWLGKPWEGGAYVHRYATPGGDSLVVSGSRPVNALESINEALSVRVLFRGVGTYVLAAQDVEVLDFGGGDILMARYRGVGAATGELRITSYDERTGRVEGTVSFFVRLTTAGKFTPPAHFEEGQFRATIESGR